MCIEIKTKTLHTFLQNYAPMKLSVSKSCPLYNFKPPKIFSWNLVQLLSLINQCLEKKNRYSTHFYFSELYPFELFFILKKRPPYTVRAHETWFKYIPPLDDVQRINKSVTPPSILRSSFEFVVMKILSAL